MSSVLSDIRVLDFGRYVAGPYCATLLGYLGAEVIRVERIGGGEDRRIAPVTKSGDDGAVFLQTSCNKKSICLKLGTDGIQDVLGKLVASADVVVCNFPAQTMGRLGLDLPSLQRHKADIILANVTAFGTTGPMAKQGGFDGVGQAMSGSMYITGETGAPVKAATPFVDYTTAVLTAFSVMAALRERDRTGKGQEISSTLLGTALAMFNSHLVEQGVLELDRVGTGNRVQTSAPSDVFETADGHVLIHSPGDQIFKRCAELIGKPEWVSDPRFKSDQSRGDHRDEICEAVATWCKTQSTEELLETLANHGIPAGPILSPREALVHEQTAALDVLRWISYPDCENPAPIADMPVKFSESAVGITTRPPLVGEHTTEVLKDLGLSRSDVDQLRDNGLIA
ncbi:MAG: CoA transferase [Pseudomonadota bacterium]